MLQKFLKEVIVIVVGKQAEDIVDLLYSKKYVNEFLIAKKLDITINQTRNVLYKISDQGLVSSIRKKDKKKGWYTYFWKIEVLKSLEFLKNILIKRKDQIDKQINSRETKEFYFCKRCSIEFNQENALLNDFTCNECGDIFSLKDNTKILKDFRRSSTRIENDLKSVEEEIEKERIKLDKEKQKEISKVKKEVAEARKIRAIASKKLRDAKKVAEEKLNPKKATKKKVAKKAAHHGRTTAGVARTCKQAPKDFSKKSLQGAKKVAKKVVKKAVKKKIGKKKGKK